MKNFKLLLATTAILSTGALVANAENPKIDMYAAVEILSVADFTNARDMDFGKWVVPEGKKSFTISLKEDGASSVDETVTIITDGISGMTSGMPCNLLSFPNSVTFDTTPSNTATATLSGIYSDDAGEYECFIYANSLVIEDTNSIPSGIYEGHFEVTAVLNE